MKYNTFNISGIRNNAINEVQEGYKTNNENRWKAVQFWWILT